MGHNVIFLVAGGYGIEATGCEPFAGFEKRSSQHMITAFSQPSWLGACQVL